MYSVIWKYRNFDQNFGIGMFKLLYTYIYICIYIYMYNICFCNLLFFTCWRRLGDFWGSFSIYFVFWDMLVFFLAFRRLFGRLLGDFLDFFLSFWRLWGDFRDIFFAFVGVFNTFFRQYFLDGIFLPYSIVHTRVCVYIYIYTHNIHIHRSKMVTFLRQRQLTGQHSTSNASAASTRKYQVVAARSSEQASREESYRQLREESRRVVCICIWIHYAKISIAVTFLNFVGFLKYLFFNLFS